MDLEQRDRPSIFDSADGDLWSDTSVGDERLTWRELCDHLRGRLHKVEAIASIVSDLDRCPHGRHEQDDCSYCRSEGHERNQGNPYLRPGTRIGTDLGGHPIVHPIDAGADG